MHSGTSKACVDKILACCDMPAISNYLYKPYERLVGFAIEECAKESCDRCAKEKRELVIKNIDTLCETF